MERRPMRIALLFTVVYLLLCAWFWPYTMDDAFISFRYAKHIGDGIGPLWNLADKAHPIEGFTSFLHVWLLGGIRFFTGADLVLPGKLLSVGAGLLLIVLIVRTIDRYRLRGAAAAVVLSVMVLPVVALNAASGMETTLFMLWNWLCTMACVQLLDDPTRASTWMFVLFGLLGTFTRPEFGAAFLLMAAVVWWRRPVARPWLWPALAVLYVFPGAIVTTWRYSYYRNFVPYAFYAKQAAGLSSAGPVYVGRFLVLCALPYLLLVASGWRALWNTHRNLLIVASLNLGLACCYFTTIKPLMGWWFRFLLPQLPLLAFSAGVALSDRRAQAGNLLAVWRVGAAALLIAINLAEVPVIARFVTFNKANEDRYRELGRRLRPFGAEDRWLMFYNVGSIVYESEWNTLDEVSLNTDRKFRRSPCVTKPDLILRSTEGGGDVPNPCPGLYEQLVDLPLVRQLPRVDSADRVFVRQGTAYADALRTSLVTNWPERFERPPDWLLRYTLVFSRFIYQIP